MYNKVEETDKSIVKLHIFTLIILQSGDQSVQLFSG